MNDIDNKNIDTKSNPSVKELSEMTGKSKQVIYRLIKRLGRVPSVEEILNRQNGRPRKY